VTDADVAEKIAQAKTKADYEALAVYFRDKAGEAATKVAFHEKMLASAVKWESGKQQSYHHTHCRTLIRSARDSQGAYEDLATEYSRLAREAER
jgi:hypothetical protein